MDKSPLETIMDKFGHYYVDFGYKICGLRVAEISVASEPNNFGVYLDVYWKGRQEPSRVWASKERRENAKPLNYYYFPQANIPPVLTNIGFKGEKQIELKWSDGFTSTLTGRFLRDILEKEADSWASTTPETPAPTPNTQNKIEIHSTLLPVDVNIGGMGGSGIMSEIRWDTNPNVPRAEFTIRGKVNNPVFQYRGQNGS